jgi:hypothetical protein
VTKKLEDGDSHALDEVDTLLREDITSYELNSTGFAAALWNWVSNSSRTAAEEQKLDSVAATDPYDCARHLTKLFRLLSSGTTHQTFIHLIERLLKM